MWVNLTAFAPNARYLSKAFENNAPPYLAYGIWNGTSNPPGPWGRVAGDAGEFCGVGSPDTSLSAGVWAHVAYVHTPRYCRFFFNGRMVGASTTAVTAQHNDEPVFIAWNEVNTSQKFVGKVDEVRISRSARSQAWMQLSYRNQRAARSVVGFR